MFLDSGPRSRSVPILSNSDPQLFDPEGSESIHTFQSQTSHYSVYHARLYGAEFFI